MAGKEYAEWHTILRRVVFFPFLMLFLGLTLFFLCCGHGIKETKREWKRIRQNIMVIIGDGWEFEDLVTGIKFKATVGVGLNTIHLEGDFGAVNNRDFYFTKDGKFDGTGSAVCDSSDEDEGCPRPLNFSGERKM